eukprot:TRINITY_DN418_c0_g3_i1.p1 TRINITY_DN418_c0_g3~~TRINITY_DN418_c0_g3_i1.p1  ORF type:complete len:477 (+),score=70.08 TRINITY_DN418_c0_g3_i1:27-1433(+)
MQGSCSLVGLEGWFLFFIIGAAPWLVVNGVFVEIPILVKRQPEGDKLAAIIGAVVQIGNLAPFMWIYCRHRFGISQKNTVGVVLGIGIICGLLLAWTAQDTVSGHSIPLLGWTFLGGICGCLSKVTWFPFAAEYREAALSAMSTGMGLSGIIGVVIGVAQNIGNINEDASNANFELNTVFYILTGINLFGLLAFVRISFSQGFKTNWVSPVYTRINSSEEEEDGDFSDNASVISTSLGFEPSPGIPGGRFDHGLNDSATHSVTEDGQQETVTFRVLLEKGKIFLLIAFLNSFFNYLVMPGLLPYLQYDTSRIFWSTTMYYIANMLGRYIPSYAVFVTPNLLPVVFFLFLTGVYLFYIGCSSDPGVGTDGESWWATIAAFVFFFSLLNGYLATMVAKVVKMKEEGEGITPKQREVLLQTIGLFNQAGSLSGTYLTLALASAGALHKTTQAATVTATLTAVGNSTLSLDI